MTFPNKQPTLPPEGTFSDAEQLFIAESPKRLFPENQNSNFGLLRRILTSEPQDAVDTLTALVAQMFVATATGTNGYLNRWETQMGLPVAPGGHTDAQRRQWVQQHRSIDLFSVGRIREVVESFLNFTSGGVPTSITVAGIPTSAAGFTLFGEGGTATSQYRLYFNPRNFSYSVWIVSTSTPDLVTLTRELKFITPAGQTVTIDNTKAAIIDYGQTILNKQPAAFYRLADFTDSSGNGLNGTPVGSFVAVSSPGLLVGGKNDDNAGQTFNGTTNYFTVPDNNLLDVGDIFTIEFWFKPAVVSGLKAIVDKGTNGFMVYQDDNHLVLAKTGQFDISRATTALVLNNIYHVVVRKSGNTVKWKINNVDVSGAVTAPQTIENTALALTVGRVAGTATWFLNGSLDELAIYDRFLTDAEITENYNAGKLINP